MIRRDSVLFMLSACMAGYDCYEGLKYFGKVAVPEITPLLLSNESIIVNNVRNTYCWYFIHLWAIFGLVNETEVA